MNDFNQTLFINKLNIYYIFSSIGQQYEIRLYREATKLGLAFRDEEHLRKYGYDKTPDCKLDVPVAIDGFIINWIESKALFGEEDAHREYKKNQYLSYWNRYEKTLYKDFELPEL